MPAALPRLFTGFKLALSYALIGVIAGEFILSGTGLGYAISFAYQSFDNRAMYGTDALRAAGCSDRQRNSLCLGGTAGAPPFTGMSDLSLEDAQPNAGLAPAPTRFRCRSCCSFSLLVLWQAVGSWTKGVAVSPPLADSGLSLRAASYPDVLGPRRRNVWSRSRSPLCCRR